MSEANNTEHVWFDNPESKTIHRFMRVGGATLTVENCNKDDSKHLEEVDEEVARFLLAEEGRHPCSYCLGSDDASTVATEGADRAPEGSTE